MDPLSVISGVVGIVAFALQLAKTASKVKKAVEEIKSAPREARELIERLVMLETACQLIGFHLERRETLPGHSSSAFPDIISKALAQCLVRIQDLEQLLSSSSTGDPVSGTPRLKFDAASRLRLVLRKEKISSLIHEIDRVISLLQFVIQVDMWTMTAGPPHAALLSNNRIDPMDESHRSEEISNTMLVTIPSSQPTVARNIRRPSHQHSRTFRYLGYITWTVNDSWIGDEDDDPSRVAHRKRSITFRLPFTSTRLSMYYQCDLGTPSYALNVSHVIEVHSELGRQLIAVMGGSPRELQKLLSGRKLSLYSLFKTRSGENNLFFMAVGQRWAEGCKYLLQHDFSHKFVEDETPPFISYDIWDHPGKICQVTETVLSVRPYDMLETDIRFLLETRGHPEYFSRYMPVFLKSPAIDKNDLLSFAWDCLVMHLCAHRLLNRANGVHIWVPAFQYLIEQGVDIHRTAPDTGASAYYQLVVGTRHPFEADEAAYFWLEILKSCGVDMRSYAQIESSFDWSDEEELKAVILDFEGLPMFSWRRDPYTESRIIEVLGEFHNFGPDSFQDGMDRNEMCRFYPSGPADFKYWSVDNQNGEWDKYCFPFVLAPIDCVMGIDDDILDGLWCRKTYIRAVEIRDNRLARRQAKKWRKAHPGEKPPSRTMPGAWVD